VGRSSCIGFGSLFYLLAVALRYFSGIFPGTISFMPPIAYSRGSVVQGLFARSSIVQARGAVANGTIQQRPGTEAFQVDMRQKSGGWPLPRDVQAKMEAALGADFSDVRIHVGPEASAIGAIAFTWGTDIHFAPGQYSPHTRHGQSLLGHELTHVVQQRAGRVANPFGSGVAVVQDHALEAEADRMGQKAAMSAMPEAADKAVIAAKLAPAGPQAIMMKPAPPVNYAVRPPRMSGSGWEISVGPQGQSSAVGSLQMTRTGEAAWISDLRVQPEHRRHGLAGQLLDAAVHTARSQGFPVAQLEARPDSITDPSAGALVSMYQRHGFRMTGMSKRGHPLMERKT
jgi:ribosomal protein S18 acetylase RimI-like enzyme